MSLVQQTMMSARLVEQVGLNLNSDNSTQIRDTNEYKYQGVPFDESDFMDQRLDVEGVYDEDFAMNYSQDSEEVPIPTRDRHSFGGLSYRERTHEYTFDEYQYKERYSESKQRFIQARDTYIMVSSLKQLIPSIFHYKQDLKTFFTEELFFSQNLQNLTRSNKEVYQVLKNDNSSLKSSLSEIYNEMKLEIYTNVNFYKIANNAKVMVMGLMKVKAAFQKYINDLSVLDDLIDEDESDECNESNDLTGLNKYFGTEIDKNIKIFDELINLYNKKGWRDHETFVYDIISFDDHLKNIVD
ncbi:hypothetical protein CLIB1444_06S04126 [[Candida] jaroonii]|uniref:Uncharacterized protein n=1 Tax=[Candida] jaroonii TaxID=467808 RepID=A0ACA9Y923_9ASCO|nr:hypothetical protein CLIB1444_06S04126 [[Candida] jaroonii]